MSDVFPPDPPGGEPASSALGQGPTLNELPGSPFGPGSLLARRYRLEGLLGEGGFGRVYRAFDQKLERPVALKVLTVSADRPERGERVQRFEEEARAIAKLDHPHIVPVYDAGTEGPLPWMVMKLIDGPNLRTLLHEEGAFAPPRALRLLLQIGKALAHAHQSGIVHRDVKPANILLAQRNGAEHAWLTDFGIAKILTGFELTLDGRILGTPSYMSPEQAIGKLVDARADIFALGCVAAELVTGRPAFQGDSVTQILQAILYGAPDLDGLRARASRRFEVAIERCLAKSPADRWQNLADLLQELENLAAPVSGSASGPTGTADSLPTLREDDLLDEPGARTVLPTGRSLPATSWYRRSRPVVPFLVVLIGLAGLFASGWLRPSVRRRWSTPGHRQAAGAVRLEAHGLPPELPRELFLKLRAYRQPELQAIDAFFRSGKRLLILEGAPGVGLGSLALTALHDLPPGAPQAIFWFDCKASDSLLSFATDWGRAFSDPNLDNLLRQREEAKSGEAQAGLAQSVTDHLLASIESSPRLVVLDHFETWLAPEGRTVADPALARFLAQFVGHTQNGRLIALSDESPALSPDLASWVERRSVPGFKKSDGVDYLRSLLHLDLDPELLARLAERYDGNPLALQLVGGSLDQVDRAQQEGRVRQLLEVGGRPFDRADLQTLFEAACKRLSAEESQVLGLLAVVRRPLTSGEIREIGLPGGTPLAAEELQATLERLVVRRHLLDRARTGGEAEDDRYALPEIERQYVEEILLRDKPYKLSLHQRALDWYRKRLPLEGIAPFATPSPLLAEYDELVHHAFAVAELSPETAGEEAAALGAEVALKLRNWHVLRGANRLMIAQFGRAQVLLQHRTGKRAQALYASCLEGLGERYMRTDLFREAEKTYQEALSLFRKLEDRQGEADVACGLGELYWHTGRKEDAGNKYEEALPLYRKVENLRGEANVLLGLADLAYERRNTPLGVTEKKYQAALALYRKIGDGRGEEKVLESLGWLYLDMDRLEEAEKRFEDALRLARKIEDRLREARALVCLGDFYQRASRSARAEETYQEAIQIFRKLESRRGEAEALKSLGFLYLPMGRLADAEKAFGEALLFYRKVEDRHEEANVLRGLGYLYLRTGRVAAAEKAYETALPFFRKTRDPQGEAEVLWLLGDLDVLTDHPAAAEKAYEEALPLYRKSEDRRGEVDVSTSFGQLYLRTDRLAAAERTFEDTLRLSRKIEYQDGEADSLRGLGDLYSAEHQPAKAHSAYEAANSIYKKIDDKPGQVKCALGLGLLDAAGGRPSAAVEKLLSALLTAARIELPRWDFQAKALEIERRIEPATFANLTREKLKAFAPADQQILRAALERLQAAGKGNRPAPAPPP